MNTNKLTIEWHSILKDIIRNIWVVILSALIGLMGVYIASRSVYSPQYTATATLVVSAKGVGGNSYAFFSSSSEMAGILTKVFIQPSMKERAAEYLKTDSFNGEISASVLSDTNFIELRVTADDPQTAYELLSAVVEVYPDISDQVFNNAVINVIRPAQMPAAPSNTISSKNRSLVVSSCIVLSLTAILILSLARDTVKSEDAFNSKISAKLLGVVYHESKHMSVEEYIRKKKKALLIHGNGFLSLRFVENFHKIAAKLEYMKRRHGDKIFAITSVAENEGKSTVAANIAVSLADRGNRVVLIDLDGKKPALYKIFGEKHEENAELNSLFSKKIKQSDFRLRRYKRTSLYLAVNTQPSPDYHNWIENGEIETLINVLKAKADYVIIDTAPISHDASVTNIVGMADKTIMVVRTDVVLASAINDAVATMNKVGGNLAGCILNDAYPDALPVSFSGRDESNYYYGKKYGKYGKYYSYREDTQAEEEFKERTSVNLNQ